MYAQPFSFGSEVCAITDHNDDGEDHGGQIRRDDGQDGTHDGDDAHGHGNDAAKQ